MRRPAAGGVGPRHVGEPDVEALDVERDLAVAGEDQPQRAGAVLARLEDEGEELEHEVAVARIDAAGAGAEHAVDGEERAHPLEGPALPLGGGRVLPAEAVEQQR